MPLGLGFLGLGLVAGRGVAGEGDPWTIGDWTPDANTSMSNTGDVYRGTLTQNTNPRLVREVSGLTSGESYTATLVNRGGSSVGMQHYFRVHSSDSGIGSGDLRQVISSTDNETVDLEFTAPADGQCYIGCVGITSTVEAYFDVEWVSFGLTP